MIRIVLSAIFLTVSVIGFSQDSLYSKVYASALHGYTIKAQTTDAIGNVAQVGVSDFDYATYTYLDSLGNVLYSKEYSWSGGPASTMQFTAVKSTSDGNFIAVGDFFMPDQGVNVGVCAKINTMGDLIWSEIIVPANPQFFKCKDVIESIENTFWVTGHDEQTGELSLLEIDQSGTQLQSYSFGQTNFRIQIKTILELDTNQLAVVGSVIDQGGNGQGYVLSIDKTGNQLWSKTYNVNFFAAQNDTNSIWIASDYSGKMAISTVAHDGSAVGLKDYGMFLDYPENVGFSYLGDSALAFCHGSTFTSAVLVTHGSSQEAMAIDHPLINCVAVSPTHQNGLYLGGNGPMFGVKSMNNDYNHSALIRLDSALLTNGQCTYPPQPVIPTDQALSSADFSVNPTTASAVNSGLLNAVDQSLNSYVGCIDFYGGLNEEDPNHLMVFPNPASTSIRLQFENASSGVMEIMTMDGKLVQQSKITANNASVSVDKLVAGTYLYRFTSSNQGVSRGKLVVE